MLHRLLLALLFTSLLFGQRTRLDEAWDLAAKGHAAEAITLLRSIVANEPKNADARLLLGSLLMEQGDRAGSIEQLSEGARLSPRSAEAQNAAGEGYTRFHESKSARGYFEKAVAINPAFAPAQANLGLVMLENSEYAAAAAHLEKAARLYGNTAEASYPQYLWARALMATNNPQDAVRHLELAVKLSPDMAEAWTDLGQVRKQLQDDPGALAAEKRSVELNPGDAIAQYRLGAEYLHQDQVKLAVEHLQAAARIDPKDQSTLNALLIALRRDGQREEAAAVKQQLADLLLERDRISQNSVTGVKLNNDGAALEKSGHPEEALAKYAEAVKLYPSHPGIRVNYAVMLLRLGHWTEGLTQLNEALKLSPDDATIRAALKDALSQAPPGTIPPGIQ
ncbi:MAG: tetratricopeptide repeat protein [Bryobacteraceae bacterium]